MNSPLQKKAGKSLYMSAPKPTGGFKAGAEGDRLLVIRKGNLGLGYTPRRTRSLRSSHRLILIELAGCLLIIGKTPSVGAITMPIFEYVCKECRHEFEALIYGSEKAECPKCHSAKLDARLSVFAVSTKA